MSHFSRSPTPNAFTGTVFTDSTLLNKKPKGSKATKGGIIPPCSPRHVMCEIIFREGAAGDCRQFINIHNIPIQLHIRYIRIHVIQSTIRPGGNVRRKVKVTNP